MKAERKWWRWRWRRHNKIYCHSTGHKTPLITKQGEGKLRSKFTQWPSSWIWAFQVSGPPQRLCVSLTIVYTCQDHVLESLKLASTENEGPPNKEPKRRFRQEWKKEFPWLHYDEEKEKMFCTVCEKAKRKNPLVDPVVDSSTSNIQYSQSMPWTMTTKSPFKMLSREASLLDKNNEKTGGAIKASFKPGFFYC